VAGHHYKNIPIVFRGGTRERKVESIQIEKVPDRLVKTKNSIGCVFKIDLLLKDNIDKFKSSNKDFITSAINTYLMPDMRRAHSKGAVDYVFSAFKM
jgi:hypothetical protein